MHISQAPMRPEAPPSLLSIPPGGTAVIGAIRLQGPMRRRLMDLGLTARASATRLFDAPSGDPRAYLIRGTVIALRNADAAAVELAQPDGEREADPWD